jgi:hypothetical protein
MKGSEYEQFVFEKFKRFFVDGVVTRNDHIKGHLSGLNREIDISVRLTVEAQQLVYIVQCKDWKTPVDIKVLGEFSAVIRDVRASKGFLLCTSGFAKSNYQYARTLGIELITIEDIKSAKWKTDVQIPFVYVRKNNNFCVDFVITANEAIVERNRDKEVQFRLTPETLFTDDEGATTVCFQDYIDRSVQALGPRLVTGREENIGRPNLHILIADVWVPCSDFTFKLLDVSKKFYLKYLKPDEYSHLRDHVRGTTLPLHVVVKGVVIRLDESFVELPDDTPPVFPGLFIQVEEWTRQEQAEITTWSMSAEE